MNEYDGLVFEQSVPGRVGYSLARGGRARRPIPRASCRRRTSGGAPAALPEVSEFDAVRHYTRLSRMNYGVDTHFYPLGSCTMKYNPKINEDMARLPGFARLHPLTPEDASQGALQLMGELGEILAEIVGMDAVSLQPAAGAQGELTGVLMIRAFHLDREGSPRKKVLVPDSAHGTNPASTAIAGYQTVQIKSDENGEVDLLDLERHLDEDVAALMITVPNTLGLFESRILEATGLCHAKGAQVYMDGANLNALLGLTRSGDLGFDVVHMNLHKTFTTPHGGGGPGRRAGRVQGAPGALHADPGGGPRRRRVAPGLEAAEVDRQGAVVLGQLRDARPGVHVHPHHGARTGSGRSRRTRSSTPTTSGLASCRTTTCPTRAPRCTRSSSPRAARRRRASRPRTSPSGCSISGFYAPSIYFPLIVDEAMMIEPTETESKETLDQFCDAMIRIAGEAASSPGTLLEAPVTTPVRRLDQTQAARQPNLRWTPREPAP